MRNVLTKDIRAKSGANASRAEFALQLTAMTEVIVGVRAHGRKDPRNSSHTAR